MRVKQDQQACDECPPANNNEGGGANSSVWRYQHFYSDSAFLQKRATLTACLRKVQKMASDVEFAVEKSVRYAPLQTSTSASPCPAAYVELYSYTAAVTLQLHTLYTLQPSTPLLR